MVDYSRLDSGASGRTIVGGKAAVATFLLMLFAFVVESQLTQYVQSNLNFRQPYLLFYAAHSSLIFIFPVHLLYLHASSTRPVSAYCRGLSAAVKQHLSRGTALVSLPNERPFPTARLISIISWCTLGITVPGLLWFAAITLASVSDVTAIWNTNAFWAYVISVKLQHSTWEPRRLAAVVVACLGVFAVVYGGKDYSQPPTDTPELVTGDARPTAPLFGNLLTLGASIGYGLYQVMYKTHAVPSNEAIEDDSGWRRLSISSQSVEDVFPAAEDVGLKHNDLEDAVYPPPFGLYANMLTSGMGLLTFFVLWIPLPIMHYLGVEPFYLPRDPLTFFTVVGIAMSGVTFNMTFMILLAVWGPIVTSVGNLLTIVLVLISDSIFGSATESLTSWSLIGSGMIVCAFAILTFDTFKS